MTSKHKMAAKSLAKQPSLFDVLKATPDDTTEARRGEIRLASFIVEHNLSFSLANHLPKLVQALCPDSEIAKKLVLGRTKCSSIVNNVIGSQNFKKLISMLKESRFSLIVDESTDVGCTKHLCLVARCLNKKQEVEDSFLALLPIHQSGTADILYSLIKDFFKENNIDYVKNMVGFGSDGANTMMGSNHSLLTHLSKDIVNLFVLKCSCHSFALCASYACKKLPESTERLLREIYKYFQFSSKKYGEFKEFQTFCSVKPHKLLHPAQTRWLSLISVVRRVLEQWNALKLFFQNEVLTNTDKKVNSAESINNMLQNIFQKMYLLFLDHILPTVINLNLEMQAEKPKIFLLYSNVEILYRTVLEMFVKPTVIEREDLCNIDFKNPHNLLPLGEIYLGGAVSAYILENHDLPKSELEKFRISCLQFYQELLDQVKNRFSFKRDDLKYMSFLIPDNVYKKKTCLLYH